MHITVTMARYFPEIVSYVFVLFIVSRMAVVAEDDKKSLVGRGSWGFRLPDLQAAKMSLEAYPPAFHLPLGVEAWSKAKIILGYQHTNNLRK